MCSKKLKNFFRAGFLGTIFGAALGLLYAKKPGKETREELKEKFDSAKDKVIDTARKTAEEVKEIKQDIAHGIKEVKEVFRDEEEK